MKSNKRNRNPKIADMAIVFPLGTLAVVGLIFIFLSSAYQPSLTFNWKEIRPEIRDTIKLIENYGSVTSDAVGIAGITPQQWFRRRWVINNATEDELKILLEYPNGAVKATAYEGLMIKPNADKFKLLNQALNDTTAIFTYQAGCIGQPMMIGEYLIESVIPISDKVPPLPSDKTEKFNFTEQQISYLRKLYKDRVEKKEQYLRKIYE